MSITTVRFHQQNVVTHAMCKAVGQRKTQCMWHSAWPSAPWFVLIHDDILLLMTVILSLVDFHNLFWNYRCEKVSMIYVVCTVLRVNISDIIFEYHIYTNELHRPYLSKFTTTWSMLLQDKGNFSISMFLYMVICNMYRTQIQSICGNHACCTQF